MKLRIVNLLLITGAFALWFVFLRPTFLGGPIDYVIVSGTSMQPLYESGDFVVTRRGDYQPGDVVAFRADGGAVIHRIVGGDARDGFTTQGDNRSIPDQWRPRGPDIMGEAWIHVPGAGSWLAHVRRPIVLAAIVGLIGFAVVTPSLVRKRIRKRGSLAMQQDLSSPPGRSLSPLWAITGFAMMVTLLCAGLAVYSFTQDETETSLVERSRYTQRTSFDYTILTQPSTLYPAGRIGPVSEAAASPSSLPPIYSRLVQSIDVGFRYRVDGAAAVTGGTYSAELVVTAGENEWSRPQQLIDPSPFDGSGFEGQSRIDLAPIRAMIETIEKETGVAANFYGINVLLHIETTGSVDGEAFTATQEPALSFRLSRSRLTLATALVANQGEQRAELVTVAREIGFAGVSLPVGRAREVSAGGMALGLVFALALAALIHTGFGQSEAGRVRMRYGAVILPVAGVEERGTRRVQVESLNDLARLAQRGDSVIFSQAQGRTVRYFITDGGTTVEFTPSITPLRRGVRESTAARGVPDHPAAS